MLISVEKEPWDADGARGLAIYSERHRIFTTSSNRLLVEYLPGFMAAAHDNYLVLTGLSDRPLPKRMPIYLMGTREQWASLTRSIFGTRARMPLSIEAGGYCHKGVCVFWDIGGLGTLSVSAHEGLHQFLHHRMKNQLPMWLEEGLCASAEGYEIFEDTVRFTPTDNASRLSNLRKAIVQDYWIPADKLLPMDAGDVIGGFTEKAVGYYGQLWALVGFLRSRDDYRAGLARLIADAEAGRLHVAMKLPADALPKLRRRGRAYNRTVSQPLFRYYITDDLATFEREYRAFAMKFAGLDD